MFRSSYGRIKKCRIKYYSIYPFPSVSLLFLQTSSKIVFQRILSKICPIKLFLFHLGQFISRMNCSNAIIFLGLCFFFLNCFHYSIHFHFVAFLSNFVSSASSFHVVLSGTGMCLFISRFCDRSRNC